MWCYYVTTTTTTTFLWPFVWDYPGEPVSYQKDRPLWILLRQRWWGGSGISWTTCKSFAPCSRQITMPTPHHSRFCRPDALPASQSTASKYWRQKCYSNKLVWLWNFVVCRVQPLRHTSWFIQDLHEDYAVIFNDTYSVFLQWLSQKLPYQEHLLKKLKIVKRQSMCIVQRIQSYNSVWW